MRVSRARSSERRQGQFAVRTRVESQQEGSLAPIAGLPSSSTAQRHSHQAAHAEGDRRRHHTEEHLAQPRDKSVATGDDRDGGSDGEEADDA